MINISNKLDLHGENRFTAKIMLEDFIEELYYSGLEVGYVICGKGKLLKKVSLEYLSKSKIVMEAKVDILNTGVIIVKIDRFRT